MATNISRKYTNISYEDIRDNLITILQAKGGRMADFGTSSYGRTLIELFAGSADLMAYYAESSFNNAFLETAYNTPAIYSGARMLGYSIRRPVPAKASFKIRTKKTGIYNKIKIFIPKGTKFTLSGSILTTMDDTEWVYDRNADTAETGLFTLASGKCICAEGYFKTVAFVGSGTQNQMFSIMDAGFSDYFGENDPNYNEDHSYEERSESFTTVTTDATLVDNFDTTDAVNGNIYWRISRRGLIDPTLESSIEEIHTFNSNENFTNNYSVCVETSNDGMVQLKFGDGLKSAIPYGTITVKYFFTNGESGNATNVYGTKIVPYQSSIHVRNEYENESDITLNDIEFVLACDLKGGLNIESIDSIKTNAPSIYNTLDRLVNKLSYQIFLKRYSDVKYANAFGEDILNTKLPDGTLDVKYMNMVRFSAIKDLYRLKDGKYYPTSADEYFLQGFKVNGLMYVWQYDNQKMPSKSCAYKFREAMSKMVDSVAKSLVQSKYPNVKVSSLSDDEIAAARNTIISNMPTGYDDLVTLPYIDSVFGAKLTPYDFVEEGSEIYCIMRALNRRGMITLGSGYHMYVYPVVHDFNIKMDLILFRGNDFSDIKENIKYSVYKYLKENTDFKTPMYRSKIESIIHSFPEVAGVNVTFEPANNIYDGLDLTQLTWLSDAASEFTGSSIIGKNDFDIGLNYTHKNSSGKSVNESISFTVTGQTTISNKILAYYKTYLSTFDESSKTYSIKSGITEDDIDKFVAFIWDLLMQSMFQPIYEKYKEMRASGYVEEANRYYDLIDAVKGWSINSDDTLSFKDTDYVFNMKEDNGTYMYNYISYGLEYVKLARNILLYNVAKSLVDSEGNITLYSMDNEIIQCEINPEDINISYERDI